MYSIYKSFSTFVREREDPFCQSGKADVTRIVPTVRTAVPNAQERLGLQHEYTPLVKHPTEQCWLFLPIALERPCLSLGKKGYVPGE